MFFKKSLSKKTKTVNVDEAVVARIRKEGKDFEILVDCDKALEYRKGRGSIEDVVAVNNIFKEVRKGEKANEHDLKNIFNTDDFWKVAEIIIKEGEVQLTKEHVAKEREEKFKLIVNIIHRNAVDPKTGLPHPPLRIENAMKEAKVRVDDNKTAEQQVETILDKLRIIIPIKFERHEIELIVPNRFASASYHVLKKYGKVIKEDWLTNGNLKVIIEIPAGIQDDFFAELNKICHGEVESKILKVK